MLIAILRSMRPRQWIKNVFVLAALVFARQATRSDAAVTALAAFGAFCLVASGIYLVNDCVDIEEDRRHPDKARRPIASGELPVMTAMAVAGILFVASLGWAVAIGGKFLLAVMAYLITNLAYTAGLKSIVILDVMLVASGFVIRAVAGGLALSVHVSHWLLLCTTMLALFLAFTKRRQELVHLGKKAHRHRESLGHYNVRFLDQMIALTASCTVIAYTLYTFSPEVVAKLGSDDLKWTIPFVLFGMFRYLYLIHVRRVPGDPTTTLVGDGPLAANVVLWGLVALAVLY
jgi:4-hydroxybenzoate polyprenyltransferase